MNKFSKVVVIIIALIGCLWVKDTFFKDVPMPDFIQKLNLKDKFSSMKPDVFNDELNLSEDGKKILGDEEAVEKLKNTGKIYFLKLNKDGSTTFFVSKREIKNPTLKDVVKTLLKGPTPYEKKSGVYTEIPDSTKLLGIMESDDKIIVNLNGDFQYGGGTESVNNRLKQLVKTIMAIAPDKNIYLYLDGKQVDVIGGEGIMITQPLNDADYKY